MVDTANVTLYQKITFANIRLKRDASFLAIFIYKIYLGEITKQAREVTKIRKSSTSTKEKEVCQEMHTVSNS